MACLRPLQKPLARGAFATLVLAFAAGCSSSTTEADPPSQEPSTEASSVPSRPKVLARVDVPKEWPGAWGVQGDAVKHITLGERVGLLFDRGDAEGAIEVPVPPDAAATSKLRLELMSDGPFVLELACGDRKTTLQGANTRRRATLFEVDLGAPGAEPPQQLTIRRQSSEHPVLLERITFVQ